MQLDFFGFSILEGGLLGISAWGMDSFFKGAIHDGIGAVRGICIPLMG